MNIRIGSAQHWLLALAFTGFVASTAESRQQCQNQLIDNSPNGSGDGFCADFWVLPHRGIWTSVFGPGPLWQMNWKAPSIEAEVATTGQYQCTDHIGRTFTLHVLLHRWFDYSEDMLGAGLTYEQTELLLARDASLSVVLADLYAGVSLVPVAALCISYTGTNGVRGNVRFVLERVPASTAEFIRSTALTVQVLGGTSPPGCYVPTMCDPNANPDCSDPVCCEMRRTCSILGHGGVSLLDCLKNLMAPYAWHFALCAVACCPLLTPATVPVYLSCVAACVGPGALVAMIDLRTCWDQSDLAKENIDISYCSCMAWKQANCPSNNNPEWLPVIPCP